jgi:5-methylcytosine-specific restriction endonuclease McrA
MRRISKTRQAKAKRLTERYADSKGIPFDEYRVWLPERVSEWPQVRRVDDYEVCKRMHDQWQMCWNCCRIDFITIRGVVQAHHIAAGTKGRSDELTNIAMLCGDCHANANTDALPLGRILFLKWKHDRQYTDWVRLALLARRHLPDLITDYVKAVSK